jgi:hypothetical protein
MKTQQDGYDAFDRLADAMVEDIVSTPAEALLAEVVEDYGRADALSVEFDRIVTPVLHKFYGGPVQAGQESRAASGATKERSSRVSPRRHLRLSEKIRGILVHLSSVADPLIFSPGVRLAAVLFFAIVGIGVPAGVYWLSGDQSGAEISGDAATDKLLGKSRGLGGETRRTVKGSEETEQVDVNYSARLSLRDSKEDVASAIRAIEVFSEFRRKYPTLVPGDSKVIPAEPNADIWFRAEFPFTTKEMADRFCDAMKMSGRCDVVPVRGSGKGG